MVDQTETNSIEPADSPKHVLFDHRIGKEVDDGGCRHAEHADFHFVTEGIESAVRGSEPLTESAFQVETKCFGDLRSKQAK
jgi:hypothetical protein